MTKDQAYFLDKLDEWIDKKGYSCRKAAELLSAYCKVSEEQVKKMRAKEIVPTQRSINMWSQLIDKNAMTDLKTAFGGIFGNIFG
jgi:hypothetical protein